MKKFATLFLLWPFAHLLAQPVIKPLDRTKPYPHVYDTAYKSPQMQKDLQVFERFRDTMFAQTLTLTPDTSVQYMLRYKGNCFNSWPQRMPSHAGFEQQEHRPYGCMLDTVDHKVYSFNMLAKLNPLDPYATVVVYGNRYVWVRENVVVHHGNATEFSRYTEYYFEKVE